jgi:large subunit GTPase 1
MGLPKSKNQVGLGNSLMNDRFGKGKKSNMHRGGTAPSKGGIKRVDMDGNEYIVNENAADDWVKMRSITEQGALDEFLSTAELAGTDFTAEKMNNVKIIHRDQKNPYLLSAAEESVVSKKQNSKRARLTVPRRPAWDKEMTAGELHEREKASFLEWRRNLAELQEIDDLLMTPFERNLEVWRQLWRVIERSDLVVQIVDARNPLMFRSDDLDKYVKEVDKKKRNLLLVNKADMMTFEQRVAWAEYFMEHGINFRFFSAELAKEVNEARGSDDEDAAEAESESESEESDEEENLSDMDSRDGLDDSDVQDELPEDVKKIAQKQKKVEFQDQQDKDNQWVDEETIDGPPPQDVPITVEEQTKILTTEDLEALFLKHAPKIPKKDQDLTKPARKTQIGLIGYPNVGKSSTINALLGAKKVSVSATPGKTKHFQTIHLSQKVVLCDCPGLVFPNFANTKAELVCNGVLPIDQLREYTGPGTLVAQRIPKAFLEAVYGMKIQTRPIEEGGTGWPTGDEVLRAYARARGFATQGLGQPDESRAARWILKDYVKGKLLFCHPPPADPPIDPHHFNRDLYDAAHLPEKRRAALAASVAAAMKQSNRDPSLMDDPDLPMPPVGGAKGKKLDNQFFAPGQGGSRVEQPFHYKYSEQGKEFSGRKLKTMTALEKDIDPADLKTSKKHFKGNKRANKFNVKSSNKSQNDYE